MALYYIFLGCILVYRSIFALCVNTVDLILNQGTYWCLSRTACNSLVLDSSGNRSCMYSASSLLLDLFPCHLAPISGHGQVCSPEVPGQVKEILDGPASSPRTPWSLLCHCPTCCVWPEYIELELSWNPCARFLCSTCNCIPTMYGYIFTRWHVVCPVW